MLSVKVRIIILPNKTTICKLGSNKPLDENALIVPLPCLFVFHFRHRGVISTRQPGIDRERGAAKYVVDVYAVDLSSGPFPLSIKTQMNIYILDRNDEPPVFSQSVYTARAKEDIVPGRIVASVKADDRDENGVLTYRWVTHAI